MRARSELSSRAALLVGFAALVTACGGSASTRGGGLSTLRPACTGATYWDGARCSPNGRGHEALAKAKKALADAYPDAALKLIERAKAVAPHTHGQHVTIYEQLGIVFALTERKQDALEAFDMLLSLSPAHLLDYRMSPKATFLFEQAREKARTVGSPDLHLRWPPQLDVSSFVPIDVEVVADPRAFLHRAVLRVRRRGDRTFRSLELSLPQAGKVRRVMVPALGTRRSEVLQLYLTAYDKAGNEVLRWADDERPREISLRYNPATPWYRKWWVWAAVGGAVAATTGATVYALTREPSDTVGGDFGVR